jgi:hypothetical protein
LNQKGRGGSTTLGCCAIRLVFEVFWQPTGTTKRLLLCQGISISLATTFNLHSSNIRITSLEGFHYIEMTTSAATQERFLFSLFDQRAGGQGTTEHKLSTTNRLQVGIPEPRQA